MKNFLAAVLVVSVASIALSQVPGTAPPRPAPQQQRWEYKVSDRGGFESVSWEKKLNDMAKEGWELDAIDQAKNLVNHAVQFSDGEGRGTSPVNVLAFAPKKKK